jgi:quinol monooxygenase YgiN
VRLDVADAVGTSWMIRFSLKGGSMFGKFFRVRVKAEKRQAFIKFIEGDIQAVREGEPETLRFDLYQDPAGENSFFVYVAYRDEKAFQRHKDINPFYKRWDSEVVGGMLEHPQHDFFERDAICSLGSGPQIQGSKR